MAVNRQKLLRNAERLVGRGKFNAAIDEYHKVLDDQPDDTNTLNRVGDLYLRLKRLDEATELFRKAADHFTEEGFFLKSIAICKKILRIDPSQLEVGESLADLQARQGLINDARRQFESVADGYANRGDLESAVSVRGKLVALEPQDPSHRLHLADLLRRADRTSEALGQYRSIAELMLAHGRVDEAIRICIEGFELDSSNLEFVIEARGLFERAGYRDEARRFVSLVEDRNPDLDVEAVLQTEVEVEAEPKLEPPPTRSEDLLEASPVEDQLDEAQSLSEGVVEVRAEESESDEVSESPEVELEEIDVDLDLDEFVSTFELMPEDAFEEPPEETDQIKELLIEADVLSRYGLEDKAVEKLQQLIQLQSRHLEGLIKLAELHLSRRDFDEAAAVAESVSEVARAQGKSERWGYLEVQLRELKFGLDGEGITVPEPAMLKLEEDATSVPQHGPVSGFPEAATDVDLSWLNHVQAVSAEQQKQGGVFADEEQFFDLASELEKELGEDVIVSQEEQTIEEIVEGFRKGMAEALDSEDYDTHYNLGIAYREMGLTDEAITEFQLAAKDPRYLIECCSLLAACFMEKGFPDLAVKWFHEGLESPMISQEESLGLSYELGDLYLSMGEKEEARQRFVDIYGINAEYRDVGAKLAELDQAQD